MCHLMTIKEFYQCYILEFLFYFTFIAQSKQNKDGFAEKLLPHIFVSSSLYNMYRYSTCQKINALFIKMK